MGAAVRSLVLYHPKDSVWLEKEPLSRHESQPMVREEKREEGDVKLGANGVEAAFGSGKEGCVVASLVGGEGKVGYRENLLTRLVHNKLLWLPSPLVSANANCPGCAMLIAIMDVRGD